MKFLDLFSGIGGFRLGLEKAGHQCVGYVEIDKYARKSYENMYNTKGEWTAHDITKVTDGEWSELKGRVDIITGGFPCQTFSIAGNRKGFDDTRGTLFFEIARAAKEIQPSFLFLENVKGLFSHDKGQTFGTIIQALDELGYIVEWGLFNSKFWGVPQNRERVFILATRKDVFEKPKLFDLMKKQENFEQPSKLLDVLEDTVEEKFYLSEEQLSKLDIKHNSPDREIKQVANRKGYINNTRTYDPTGISGTLDTAGGGGREVHIKVVGNTSNTGHRSHDVHDPNGISPTIAARDYKGAKQIVDTLQAREVNQGVFTSSSNFYAKDDVLCNDEQYKKYEFEPDYVYVEPDILKLNDSFMFIIDEVNEQYELVEVKENYYLSLDVFHNLNDLLKIQPKKEYGRMGRQAVETFKENINDINVGDVLNAYNKTVDKSGVSPTLTTRPEGFKTAILPLTKDFRIRKLTPKECFRLQGFSDDLFEKAQSVNSNSQLYKQAGNSVTVNVIEAIAKTL